MLHTPLRIYHYYITLHARATERRYGNTRHDVFVLNAVGPTDCIVEGEVLKLGGPFLQTWQKKHLKLYPNRLEFYPKSRDGQIVKGKGVEVSPSRANSISARSLQK